MTTTELVHRRPWGGSTDRKYLPAGTCRPQSSLPSHSTVFAPAGTARVPRSLMQRPSARITRIRSSLRSCTVKDQRTASLAGFGRPRPRPGSRMPDRSATPAVGPARNCRVPLLVVATPDIPDLQLQIVEPGLRHREEQISERVLLRLNPELIPGMPPPWYIFARRARADTNSASVGIRVPKPELSSAARRRLAPHLRPPGWGPWRRDQASPSLPAHLYTKRTGLAGPCSHHRPLHPTPRGRDPGSIG